MSVHPGITVFIMNTMYKYNNLMNINVKVDIGILNRPIFIKLDEMFVLADCAIFEKVRFSK